MRGLKWLSWLFSAVLVGGLALAFWLLPQLQQIYHAPIHTTASSYTVPSGSHMGRIAKDFAAQGWVENADVLRHWYRVKGLAHQVRAGEFPLHSGDTVADLMQRIIDGEVVQYSVTVVEGMRFRDFRNALASAEALTPSTRDWTDAQIMAALDAEQSHPEGQFFPDTYFYSRGDTDLSVLRRAYLRLQQTLAQEWQQRDKDLPLKTPYEALILASIIEKETGLPEEREAIAGVFVRRLNKGMKLQTDPTIIYGMGDRYKGNIRRADILEATPYNTYVIKGLPPTPIALPGAAAIRATLHPAAGEALYFVATGDGGHYFSATLEEHNRAVRKYQLKR